MSGAPRRPAVLCLVLAVSGCAFAAKPLSMVPAMPGLAAPPLLLATPLPSVAAPQPATLNVRTAGGDRTRLWGKSQISNAALAEAVDVVLPAHNEPTMPSSQLVALRDAFHAMRQEGAAFVLTDGNREYDFGRFSILVSDPPPWAAEE